MVKGGSGSADYYDMKSKVIPLLNAMVWNMEKWRYESSYSEPQHVIEMRDHLCLSHFNSWERGPVPTG
jgi:hypothetical protein